ncbi:hypothetical protein SISSUDRAFT_1057969 [Sistotremastrum suecicum HHB10207 ss-3]|uniref:VPS9 domain-containing protein n=1 Tax=Sistotremastrum suecicum HHB10207 ss-3 TaxID=1314776 RepID=A0A166HYF8_9AGAM|nr:hypothetical protein SISSUDRAFT_1057969 [Sistotremastrum suecicum HHB10207 ss-3]
MSQDGMEPSATVLRTSSSSSQSSSFDFSKFLDQMKSKGAEPIAKYLRSFLSNFSKKAFSVNDQIKVIQDFLGFISVRMRECEVWSRVSESEFENATEAMEKLVMNRLYDLTFSPSIAQTNRPLTTDDIEKDNILSQRIRFLSWIREEHLDIPPRQDGFLDFAKSELLKINHYKAPRDKLICILNACKVIFGLIRHSHSDESADTFMPLLIFLVIQSNPDHLISNVEYIQRFRSPAKLKSEAGYYLSSLMAAVSFIETLDHTCLANITPEEFEHNVEEAIKALPPPSPNETTGPTITVTQEKDPEAETIPPHAGEESAQPLSMASPDLDFTSMQPFSHPSAPNFNPLSLAEDTKSFFRRTGDSISKPLGAIGKIISTAVEGKESSDNGENPNGYPRLPGPFSPLALRQSSRSSSPSHPPPDGLNYVPYKSRLRPDTPQSSSDAGAEQSPDARPTLAPRVQTLLDSRGPSRASSPLLDLSELSESIATIDARTAEQGTAAMNTLRQIFPTLETDVLQLVLEASDGDVGMSIDRLLEMSGG